MTEMQGASQREILARNIAAVQARIAEAAGRVGRSTDEITLVAVSKTKPLALIEQAYDLGIRHFGENRVQEALSKIEDYQPPGIQWHLIGHLQSNKAGKVYGQFACLHSIDSLHLAETLNRTAEKVHERGEQEGEMPRQKILLQVNVSGETSKEGMHPEETISLARQIAALPYLEIQGLMTIAPLVADVEEVRPVFRGLQVLQERLREEVPQVVWQHLSMGMTDDYAIAIEEGATIVRIGRAIFGTRAN